MRNQIRPEGARHPGRHQSEWPADINRNRWPTSARNDRPKSSESASNRLTGAANLNAYADVAPFKLTGFTGYAYTWVGSSNAVLAGVPPFSNNIRFGVFKLGGEAGCQFDQ